MDKSSWEFIKEHTDRRETFAYQDTTEYPTIKVNNTISTTSFVKAENEYVVGIEIVKADGFERKLAVRDKEFEAIFGTYEKLLAYLRLNGFYRKEQQKAKQITIDDLGI